MFCRVASFLCTNFNNPKPSVQRYRNGRLKPRTLLPKEVDTNDRRAYSSFFPGAWEMLQIYYIKLHLSA